MKTDMAEWEPLLYKLTTAWAEAGGSYWSGTVKHLRRKAIWYVPKHPWRLP